MERRLGYALPSFSLPDHDGAPADHLGIEPEHGGTVTVGVPVHVGLISGEQMVALAGLVERYGADVRLTRQQNFAITGVRPIDVEELEQRLVEIGLPRDLNPVRGHGIACTGEPHCNFAVTETKTRLDRLIGRLETEFGPKLNGIHLHLDGCPHACGQHWVGEIGFQGTTVRDQDGKPHQAFDVLLRGALGPDAAIGRPVFRRVASTELDDVTVRLVGAWVEGRGEGETFRRFVDRHSDGELGVIVGREPARRRGQEEA